MKRFFSLHFFTLLFFLFCSTLLLIGAKNVSADESYLKVVIPRIYDEEKKLSDAIIITDIPNKRHVYADLLEKIAASLDDTNSIRYHDVFLSNNTLYLFLEQKTAINRYIFLIYSLNTEEEIYREVFSWCNQSGEGELKIHILDISPDKTKVLLNIMQDNSCEAVMNFLPQDKSSNLVLLDIEKEEFLLLQTKEGKEEFWDSAIFTNNDEIYYLMRRHRVCSVDECLGLPSEEQKECVDECTIYNDSSILQKYTLSTQTKNSLKTFEGKRPLQKSNLALSQTSNFIAWKVETGSADKKYILKYSLVTDQEKLLFADINQFRLGENLSFVITHPITVMNGLSKIWQTDTDLENAVMKKSLFYSGFYIIKDYFLGTMESIKMILFADKDKKGKIYVYNYEDDIYHEEIANYIKEEILQKGKNMFLENQNIIQTECPDITDIEIKNSEIIQGCISKKFPDKNTLSGWLEIQNNGDTLSKNIRVRLYAASSKESIQADDKKIESQVIIEGLEAGETQRIEWSGILNDEVGEYYLGTDIISHNVIPEKLKRIKNFSEEKSKIQILSHLEECPKMIKATDPEVFTKGNYYDVRIKDINKEVKHIHITDLWNDVPSQQEGDSIILKNIRIPEFLASNEQDFETFIQYTDGTKWEGVITLTILPKTENVNYQFLQSSFGCHLNNVVDSGKNVQLNFELKNTGGGTASQESKVFFILCDTETCIHRDKKEVLRSYIIPPLQQDETSEKIQENIDIETIPEWYQDSKKGYLVLILDYENNINEGTQGEKDNIINKAVVKTLHQGEKVECVDPNQEILSYSHKVLEDFSANIPFSVVKNKTNVIKQAKPFVEEKILLAGTSSSDISDNTQAVLADLQESPETLLSPTIKHLAKSLHYHPKEIYDYLNQEIEYIPYYGSRKGAEGCLREKFCNDYDLASLGIALLRASSIPARYQKATLNIRADIMRGILGVTNNKSAYLFLANRKGTSDEISLIMKEGKELPKINDPPKFFENIEAFRIPWVYSSAYLHYTHSQKLLEKSRIESWEEAGNNEELQEKIEHFYPRIWIPFLPLLHNYEITQEKNIFQENDFSIELFIENYIQNYQQYSPLRELELQNSISEKNREQFAVKKTKKLKKIGILPNVLPVLDIHNSGKFSYIPEDVKGKIHITLRAEGENPQIYFEKILDSTKLIGKEVEIRYEGFNERDQNTIQDAGNLFHTNISDVQIGAQIILDGRDVTEDADRKKALFPGDIIVLETEFYIGDSLIKQDKKYSTAGATEGLFFHFGVAKAYELEDHALHRGYSGLAREYFQKTERDLDEAAQLFGQKYFFEYGRSIVGDKLRVRETAEKKHIDFIGMQMDSSFLMNNQSYLDDPENNSKAFRKLAMLTAAYYEHQHLKDESHLESISTIRALQYAYSHPEHYTIYKINKDNEYQLDFLNLSQNIKQLMQQDIDNGYTVITPNKRVHIFSWEDSVYLSFNQDTGEGRYYLGDRVLNGGDSAVCISDIKVDAFTDVCLTRNNQYYKVKKEEVNKQKPGFIFATEGKETRMGDVETGNMENWLYETDIWQRKFKEMTISEFYNVRNDSRINDEQKQLLDSSYILDLHIAKLKNDWAADDDLLEIFKIVEFERTGLCPNFGYPIRNKETYNYGKYKNTVWEFSNGAKFYSPYVDQNGNGVIDEKDWGYTYTEKRENIESVLKDVFDISNKSAMEFSPYSGTFLMRGSNGNGYYVPNSAIPNFNIPRGYGVPLKDELLVLADKKLDKYYYTQIYNHQYGAKYCWEPHDTYPVFKTYTLVPKCRKLIAITGFPIDFEKNAPDNNEAIDIYQEFLGGFLYLGKDLGVFDFFRFSLFGIRDVLFVPGDKENTMIFPLDDPYFLASNDTLTQEFREHSLAQFYLPEETLKIVQVDLENLRANRYSCDIIQHVENDVLIKAYLDGLVDAGVDEINGAWEMLTHPIDTVNGVWMMIRDPITVFQGVAESLGREIEAARCNGRKAYLAGKATAIVGTAILADKGLTKVTKALKATRAGVWLVKIGDKVNDIKRLIIDRVKNTSKLLKNKVTAYWTKRFEDFLEERIKRKNISNKVDDVLYEVEVKKMADEVSEEVIEGMNREVMKSLGEIYDISEDRITHVIKGNFDETGRFTGGLHSAKGMKNVIKKGKNQIRDMEGNIIDSIEKFNALVHNNGVKEVKIWNVKRNIWEPKTLFPDEWDMEEIVKAGDYVKKNYITEDITELFKDGAAQVVEKKYIYKEKDYFIREVFYKDGSINTWYILE